MVVVPLDDVDAADRVQRAIGAAAGAGLAGADGAEAEQVRAVDALDHLSHVLGEREQRRAVGALGLVHELPHRELRLVLVALHHQPRVVAERERVGAERRRVVAGLEPGRALAAVGRGGVVLRAVGPLVLEREDHQEAVLARGRDHAIDRREVGRALREALERPRAQHGRAGRGQPAEERVELRVVVAIAAGVRRRRRHVVAVGADEAEALPVAKQIALGRFHEVRAIDAAVVAGAEVDRVAGEIGRHEIGRRTARGEREQERRALHGTCWSKLSMVAPNSSITVELSLPAVTE